MTKAIVTVLGSDRVGIIAAVTKTLSQLDVNILDITQTIMTDNIFVMLALVDLTASTAAFPEIKESLDQLGKELGVSIRIQREEIFNAMHRV